MNKHLISFAFKFLYVTSLIIQKHIFQITSKRYLGYLLLFSELKLAVFIFAAGGN